MCAWLKPGATAPSSSRCRGKGFGAPNPPIGPSASAPGWWVMARQITIPTATRLSNDALCGWRRPLQPHPPAGWPRHFGSSIDDRVRRCAYHGDPAAPIANEGLARRISSDTVDFAPNFRRPQQEPTVLPALPALPVAHTGSPALPWATGPPAFRPTNLAEVVEALIALIPQPRVSDEQSCSELVPRTPISHRREVLTGSGVAGHLSQRPRQQLPNARRGPYRREIQPGKGRPPPAVRCDQPSCPISLQSRRAGSRSWP